MKRRRKINPDNFQLLGYDFNKRNTLFTLSIAAVVFAMLFLISLLDIGGRGVNWYGVLIGTGFLLALLFAIKICEIKGLDTNLPYELLWWVFPFSIIGARLYYIMFNPVTPFFWKAFAVWDGGLAIYGGIIGGFIAVVIYSYYKKIHLFKLTDIIVPGLAIGQALGRIGCVLAGCCYGVVVQSKWFRWFPAALNIHGTYHYATNFYEAILNAVLFLVLITLVRKTKLKGLTSAIYLVAYGIYRYILEFFRDPAQTLYTSFGMPISQLVSVIFVIAGTAIIAYILLNNKQKGN